MKRNCKIIIALHLLALFVTYQAGIAAFTHVHYINGVMIRHSHPFQSTHSHTQSSLLVIGLLPVPLPADVQSCDVLHPYRSLEAVLAIPQLPSACSDEAIRICFLRAPPACSYRV
ncbi:MAG: hypothetical protein ACI37U_10200 [Bacteroides sp.]